MIKLSSLNVGTFRFRGGQGDVYELDSDPRLLLKRYRADVAVDEAGLRALVDWRKQLQPKDFAVIDKHAAWPLEVVDCEDGTYGILMNRAPQEYWHTVEGATLPRDLSWAFMEDAARFVGLEPAPPTAAVLLMVQIATVFDVFHRNGVAYGDLSATNVLWTGGNSPSVLLIDCDSAGITGQPRALQEVQTPLWNCPWPGVEAQERDQYKLAIAFLRLFFRYEGPIMDTTRNIQVPSYPPVTQDTASLLGAGLKQVSIRPAPADWLPALQQLHRGLKARKVA
jgi:DNA-binding helix-hairpin-helix protein with protein kinase domain